MTHLHISELVQPIRAEDRLRLLCFKSSVLKAQKQKQPGELKVEKRGKNYYNKRYKWVSKEKKRYDMGSLVTRTEYVFKLS